MIYNIYKLQYKKNINKYIKYINLDRACSHGLTMNQVEYESFFSFTYIFDKIIISMTQEFQGLFYKKCHAMTFIGYYK